MHLRLVPIDTQHPRRVALVYGPVVLVQDARNNLWPTRMPGDRDLSRWIVREGDSLGFRVAEPSQGVFAPAWGRFAPFYRTGPGVPYRMYFDLQT
ncbi:MAG: hypothetical protein ABSH47_22050 [Bryobacteraceae bacterium]|jgi:hypothetical protein